MKQFFKFMFASMLGTAITLIGMTIIMFAIFFGVVGSMFSDFDKSKQVTQVDSNSILHIKFEDPIVDRGSNEDVKIDFGPFSATTKMGLDKIKENLEKAKNDKKIEGIFLDVSYIPSGLASLDEIRTALIDFKESGKWIVSYSEMYTQKAYYLASTADEIYIYPEGSLDFKGLSVSSTFYKGLFEKLEIEPQIIRGSNNKYKSAVEPYFLEEMSQANRAQTEKWSGSIWNTMLANISATRNITPEKLQEIADNYSIQQASDAVDHGLATATVYYDEVIDILAEKVGAEDDDEIALVDFKKYFRSAKPKRKKGETPSYKKPKIAVVYATGQIISGEGDEEIIGSETVAKAIRDARQDTSVKAIVLRVNSPGGSALASDVIWRESVLAKEAKPFIVSMGNVAASGGYYISAAADKIYAMPNTITGSIGVFGVIPNLEGMMNNKLGVTFDGVKTAKYADFPDVMRPLSDEEFGMIQESVDQIYNTFLSRVSQGRNLSVAQVDEIGQGRVWSGVDALEIGLVDELGGLDDALAFAAEQAELDDYRTKNYPELKDPFEKLLEDMYGMSFTKLMEWQFGDQAEMVNEVKNAVMLRDLEGVQALMPHHYMIR